MHVELPENIDKQSPTMTLIYDENGQLLWAQRDVPWLMKMIQPDWLKSNGFHEIEADVNDTSLLLRLDVHGTQYAAHDGTKDRRGNGAAVVFTRLRIVDNNNQREARLTRRRNACGISNIFIDVATVDFSIIFRALLPFRAGRSCTH